MSNLDDIIANCSSQPEAPAPLDKAMQAAFAGGEIVARLNDDQIAPEEFPTIGQLMIGKELRTKLGECTAVEDLEDARERMKRLDSLGAFIVPRYLEPTRYVKIGSEFRIPEDSETLGVCGEPLPDLVAEVAKPHPRMENRVKVLWVDERYLLDLFQGPRQCMAIKIRSPKLPDDARVERVTHDWSRRAIGLLVHSAEFPIVPCGMEAPHFEEPGDLWFEYVEIKSDGSLTRTG